MTEVTYQCESNLSVGEFIDLLQRSTLAARRPVDEPNRVAAMLKHADIILTARVGGHLAGVSRAMTDYSWCTYLSDLAVDVRHQKQGIGKELVRRTHDVAGRDTTLILLAAPDAKEYYPHIGMEPHDSCWVTHRSTGREQ